MGCGADLYRMNSLGSSPSGCFCLVSMPLSTSGALNAGAL